MYFPAKFIHLCWKRRQHLLFHHVMLPLKFFRVMLCQNLLLVRSNYLHQSFGGRDIIMPEVALSSPRLARNALTEPLSFSLHPKDAVRRSKTSIAVSDCSMYFMNLLPAGTPVRAEGAQYKRVSEKC